MGLNTTSRPSKTPRAREVRIFLSSTFRDMQCKREHLVKHVFPELRRFFRERLVELTEVDLRWGIPEEEAQSDVMSPFGQPPQHRILSSFPRHDLSNLEGDGCPARKWGQSSRLAIEIGGMASGRATMAFGWTDQRSKWKSLPEALKAEVERLAALPLDGRRLEIERLKDELAKDPGKLEALRHRARQKCRFVEFMNITRNPMCFNRGSVKNRIQS